MKQCTLWLFVSLQEIPEDIGQDGHKAIFYLIIKTNNVYKFESSLYKHYYLGFENDSSAGYDKLTLHYNIDQVDEGLQITLEDVTEWMQLFNI